MPTLTAGSARRFQVLQGLRTVPASFPLNCPIPFLPDLINCAAFDTTATIVVPGVSSFIAASTSTPQNQEPLFVAAGEMSLVSSQNTILSLGFPSTSAPWLPCQLSLVNTNDVGSWMVCQTCKPPDGRNALNLPFYFADVTSNVITWSPDRYSYPLAPRIDRISADNGCTQNTNMSIVDCSTRGGVWMTITGINFINVIYTNVVLKNTISSATCVEIVILIDTISFKCLMPEFVGRSLSLLVLVFTK